MYKSIKDIFAAKRDRANRRGARVRQGLLRPASEFPDMGHQSRAAKVLGGSGMGFGDIVMRSLGPPELRAFTATSIGTRRGASNVIIERGYRYVKIVDAEQKNMNGPNRVFNRFKRFKRRRTSGSIHYYIG